MLRSIAVCALAVVLLACARPRATRPAAVPVATTPNAGVPSEGPRVAAIALGPKDSVDLTADGTMLDVTKDQRIVVNHRVVAVQREHAEGTYSCHLDYDTGPYDFEGDYVGEAISLVDARGEATVVIDKNPKEETENALSIDQQRLTFLGAVGHYVFVRQERVVFGCGGAHPFRGVEGFIYDTELKSIVFFLPPEPALERVKTELAGKGFDDDPKLVEVIPRFDPEGRLSLAWRFEKSTSYAEREGDGSDYTLSVVVESNELPEQVAAYRDPPPAIRNYLANGGEPITGWTTL